MEDENKISSNIDNLTVTNSCLYESKKSMRGVSIGIIFCCGVAVGLLSVVIYQGFLAGSSKFFWLFIIISILLIFIFIERVMAIWKSPSNKNYYKEETVFKK